MRAVCQVGRARARGGKGCGKPLEFDELYDLVVAALDEDLLQEVAGITGGTYNQAGDAEALTGIYKSIDLEFRSVARPREVTALFAAAGGLLLAAASFLSIVWLGRVV